MKNYSYRVKSVHKFLCCTIGNEAAKTSKYPDLVIQLQKERKKKQKLIFSGNPVFSNALKIIDLLNCIFFNSKNLSNFWPVFKEPRYQVVENEQQITVLKLKIGFFIRPKEYPKTPTI